jgi:hypothetical protein
MRPVMIQKLYRKYENGIWAGIIIIINVILLGICFDIYYDLNDDTMMKDIMAGVYSGVPDGHNMQTLYVLGAFISLCYRLCRTVPWYGLFLCLCQFGCFYLAGTRLCSLTGKKAGKLGMMALLSLFLWAVCLQHLVNVQYTITCAIMSAAAIFLFVTTPRGISTRQFILKNIPSMALVILAYQLRTEMLLLTFPFIGMAGIVRWSEEERIFTGENWKKYGTVLGIMLAGMLVSRGVDFLAYGSEEWRAFQDFFHARTSVYDFYPDVLTQDVYGDGLSEIGVSQTQQMLLQNYNFGLDENIDSQMLEGIAEYAAKAVGGTRDWGTFCKERIGFYIYRTLHGEDAPYNILVLWAYAAVFLAGVLSVRADSRKRWGSGWAFLWQLALMAVMRSAVWMFILMRGRDPERITHSLYLVEFVLLAAMLLQRGSLVRRRKGVIRAMVILLAVMQAGSLGGSIRLVQEDQALRAQVNQDWQAIDRYCREREDNFYFEDVYSTVAFSQKIFAPSGNRYANYDILGGWMSKSPLYREKIAVYHIREADTALLDMENVYMVVSNEEADAFDWLTAHYAQKGILVQVQQSDSINDNYSVYQIVRIGEKESVNQADRMK